MNLSRPAAKSLWLHVVSILLVLSLGASAFAVPDGDVDGDCRITAADALLVLRAVVGLDPITPRMQLHGDVAPLGADGDPLSDGIISLADALIILQKSVGLVFWTTPPPAITSQPQTAILTDVPFTYQVTLTSPRNVLTRFFLDQAPAGMTIDSNTGLLTWTPLRNQAGNQLVVVSAGESTCGRVKQTFVVQVSLNPATNQVPVARAGSNQIVSIAAGQTTANVTLDGSSSSGPNGTITGYAWSGVGGAPQPTPATGAKPTVTLGTGSYTFSLVVTDNLGATSAPATVTVTINPAANQAPVARAGSNQTVTLASGQTTANVALDGSTSTAPGGTIVSYAWSGINGAPQPTPATGAKPTVTLGTGSYTFSLVVTDNLGATSAPATVTVTINPAANQAPVARAGSNQTVTLASGQTTANVALDGSASTAPGGTIVGYAWSGINGAPQPTPATGAKPTVTLGTGSYTFSLVVTDNQGATSAPTQVTVTVNPPGNQAPVANAGSNQTVTLASGQTTANVTLDGSASTDPDGTIVGYAWSGINGAPQPTPATGVKPTVTLGTGTYTFSLVVTDNQGATSAPSQVTVTVNPPGNQAPVANAGSNQTITLTSGQTTTGVTLDGSASSDADGTIAGYTWSGVGGAPQPTPATVARPTATINAGTYTFSLVVTDNQGATSAPSQVTVTVNPPGNQAPVANAGSNQTITLTSGQTTTSVTLDGSASSDVDGTIAGYSWSGVGGAPQPTPATGARPTVTLGTGSYTFSLVVTDNQGATSVPAQVTVSVNPPGNKAPVANAGSNQTVTLASGQTTANVTLDGSASIDPDGTIVGYAWSGINGAPQPTPATGAKPTVTLGTGTFTFSLVVTDNKGATSAPSTVTVTINPAANQAPVARAGSNQTITLTSGQTTTSVMLDGSASSDVDGTIAGYSWSGVGGAPQPTPATGAKSTVTLGTGSYTFSLIVTDNQGATSAPSTVTVTVNPAANQAPVARAGANQIITLTSGQTTATVTLDGSASSDPDGTIASYAWSGINGSPQPTPANGAKPTVTLTAGIYTFSLVVTDNQGATSAPSTVSVSINPAGNSLPKLDPIGAKSTAEMQQLQFVVTGSDPDGNQLTFSTGPLPTGALFTPATRTFTWTPDYTQAGKYDVTFRVSDGFVTVSETVTITVSNVNRKPVLTPIGPKSVNEGQKLQFTVVATDPDGDPLTYVMSPTPAGATLNQSTGLFSWTPSYTQAGSYDVTFEVRDGTDTVKETVTITVVNVNLNATILTATLPLPKIDIPYSVTLDVSNPDGDSLTFTLGSGAPSGMAITAATGVISWRPGVSEIGKSYRFAISVSDGRGGTDSRTYDLAIADTIPPVVKLNAPVNSIPGSSFTVSADASDNIGVTKVQISVDGKSRDYAGPPYTYPVTVSQVAAIGSTVPVTATAWDAVGNSGTASMNVAVIGTPTVTPPTVTLNVPAKVTTGSTVIISATATSSQGVARLEFSAGTQAIATTVPPVGATTYPVPSNLAAGDTIAFAVTATDFSGNSATAQAQSTVADLPSDTVPPAITLTVPPSVTTGTKLPITLKVTDDRGVASVEISLGHQLVTTNQGPLDQTIELPLPSGVEAGMDLAVDIKAVDASGNTATASATTRMTAPEVRQGLLTGSVFDDSTGLPLMGMAVTYSSAGGTTRSATTDDKGRYSLVVDEGSGSLTVTGAGYSRADLPAVTVVMNSGLRLSNARLTPLGTGATPVAAVLGGTVSTPFTAQGSGLASALAEAGVTPPTATHMDLVLPPGALSVDQEVTVIQVSAQGLQGRLPAGWSPVAAFTLKPAGLTLATPADVTVPNLLGAAVPATILLAWWDESHGIWKSFGNVTISSDRTTLAAKIPATGHFAFVVPDAAASLPALPGTGGLLPAIAQPAFPQTLQSLVKPDPKVIFYKPGVKSAVGTRVEGTSALASGSLIHATVAEDYAFYSGDKVVGAPYDQEIILYTFGLPGGVLLADYPVSPAPSLLAGLVLEKGIITVTAGVPPVDADKVAVIGPQGGIITSSGGETLTVPAGAVLNFVPVSLTPFSLAASGLAIPDGFTLVGGVVFSATGTGLAQPATLSIPKPSGFTEGGDLLLVRVVKVNGATRFAVIGSGALDAGRIVAVRDISGTTLRRFPGIVAEGTILLLQATRQLGYAGGTVTGIDAAPFGGAVITGDSLPLVALSAVDGGYATVTAAGPFILTGLDPVKLNKGTVSGTVAARQYQAADITLQIQLPAVASVTPAAGAVDVTMADPVKVRFTKPLDPATVTAAAITLTSAAGPVSGILSLSSDGLEATLRPAMPLEPKTVYTVTVATTIRDIAGYAMTAPFTSSFTSLDTNPPPAPPAGSVTATIPGSAHTTTVIATQGTAGLHDTVFIVNLTTGARNQVQVDPNGGISAVIPADLKDLLQIEITNPAGATTSVTLPRFRQENADGSVSAVVGPEGGVITGLGGVTVDVPAAAFDAATIIKLKPVSESEFPVQLSDTDKLQFSYSGGMSLDFGAQTPHHYLNISIPTSVGDSTDDQWVVVKVVPYSGANYLHPIDTAHIINGSIRTSSPPCPGVTASGVYGLLKSRGKVGVLYGNFRDAAVIADAYQGETTKLPYSIIVENTPTDAATTEFCIPIPTGSATITPNSIILNLYASELRKNDLLVEVKNSHPSGTSTVDATTTFTRSQLYYSVQVDGTSNQQFDVTATSNISGIIVSDTMRATNSPSTVSGKVNLLIQVDDLPGTANEVVVKTMPPVAPSEYHFPVSGLIYKLRVDGGATDTYTVKATEKVVTASATVMNIHPVNSDIDLSSINQGRLVLRVAPGTIDPSQADIDAYNSSTPPPVTPINGPAVIKVELIDEATSPGTRTTLWAPTSSLTTITKGGFTYAFDGDISHTYHIDVTYGDSVKTVHQIRIPKMQFRVSSLPINPDIPPRIVTVPIPPQNDPRAVNLNVPGLPPTVTSTPVDLDYYDPTKGYLTFTFSESMDPATLNSSHIIMTDNSGGGSIAATITKLDKNQKITITPTVPIQMGSSYTISFTGLKDTTGTDLGTINYTVNVLGVTKAYQIIRGANPDRDLEPLQDIALFSKNPTGGNLVVAVADLPSGAGHKLIILSPKSSELKELGYGIGGFRKRVTVLENVDIVVSGNASIWSASTCGGHVTQTASGVFRFKGDMAVAVSSDIGAYAQSFITFYDITNPVAPCTLGLKILTAGSENLTDLTRKGTLRFVPEVRGVTTVRTADAIQAYVAFTDVGIMQVDIGKSIPEMKYDERVLEGVYSGNYIDIVNVGDRLVAANPDANQLEIFDPNLAPVATLPLTNSPKRMAYSGSVFFDVNGNGTEDPGERQNLLFVGEVNAIEVVDVSNIQSPSIRGSLPAPGKTTALDVDWANRRLYAISGNSLLLYNVSSINFSDYFNSGSSKLLWKYPYPPGLTAKAIKGDPDTGDFYVATKKDFGSTLKEGLDIYQTKKPNLTGSATYSYFKVELGKGLSLIANPPFIPVAQVPKQLPIRGAVVELIDKTSGNVLATKNTTPEGKFSFTAPENTDLLIRVKAELGTPGAPRLRVVDVAACNAPTLPNAAGAKLPSACPSHFFDTNTIRITPPAAPPPVVMATKQQTYTAVGGWNVRDASQFAILDTIYGAEAKIRSQVDSSMTFPSYQVVFDPTNLTTSTSWNSVSKSLEVNGKTAADSDEYDSAVILHEWLHYFSDTKLRSDNLGGSHTPGEKVDPTLAFNEGGGTAMGAILAGNKDYVDTGTHGTNSVVAPTADLELDTPRSGIFCEDCISQLMWDLNDPKDSGVMGAPTDPDVDGFPGFTPTGTVVIDKLELDFKYVFGAIQKTKDQPSFNTIVTFMNDVRGLQPPAAVGVRNDILRLANAEGIPLVAADSYDVAANQLYNVVPVTVSPNPPIPLSTFTINNSDITGAALTGQPLGTLDINDVRNTSGQNCRGCLGNKAGEVVYLRFSVAPGQGGPYTITLAPSNANWIMGCELRDHDKRYLFQLADTNRFPYRPAGGTHPAGSYSFTTPPLQEGDIFMRVFTAATAPAGYRYRDNGAMVNADYIYAPQTFTVTVTK